MIALYSPTSFTRDDATPRELLGGHPSGKLILREIEKLWPGVMLVERDQVGMIFRNSARKEAA